MQKLLLTIFAVTSFSVEAKNFDVDKIKEGLESKDSQIISSAIDSCTSLGKDILPKLRAWATNSDPRLKTNARKAIGRITGQWASQTDLIWHRDIQKAQAQAKKENKPMMVLHLFGKLDEEFC